MDKVCLQPLGQDVLNFKSPKAYDVFISCKDTHKAWESFEIFMHGTMLELVHKYVQETEEEPTPNGFLKWQNKCTSATLKLVLQLILTFGFGIYAQKVGDRNNDFSVSNAGRYAFLDWFYGFNHPLYREIEYRDLMNKSIYPKEVGVQMQNNLSFSSYDVQGRHQGGDFLLEQKVQRQKLLAPKGVVEKNVWQRISRSVDTIDKIYANASSDLMLFSETKPRFIKRGNSRMESCFKILQVFGELKYKSCMQYIWR